jgi:hypothetical protein
MWAIFILILNNLVKFAVPIGMFIWSLFQPTIAGYSYVAISTIFSAYLFFIDIAGKPQPDPLLLSPNEIRVLKLYHLAIRFPYASRDLSCCLNGIRLSSFVWVPWLLYDGLWIPAVFFIAYFFVTASLSVRLDPFFFFGDAISHGKKQYCYEFMLLKNVTEKLKRMSQDSTQTASNRKDNEHHHESQAAKESDANDGMTVCVSSDNADEMFQDTHEWQG